MGISLKKFINDYTPAGALYKAATGGKNLTDDAGEAWSKAIDKTGISANLGDAGQAAIKAANGGLVGMISGKDTVAAAVDGANKGLVGMVTDTNPSQEVWNTVTDTAETITGTTSNVVDTVKETVQNVTKGVSGALPYIAVGGAVILGAALLFGRR